MRNTRFRVLFNAVSTIVLLIFFYNSTFDHNHLNLNSGFHGEIHQIWSKHGRIMEELIHEKVPSFSNGTKLAISEHEICAQVYDHKGYPTSCAYLQAHPECNSGGFLNYIKFIYCDCKNFPFFGYLILAIWLAVLFYLLGNTAADYFCCSLEKLSDILKMSPTVAGVTLLPFGNGAPDVFASIASFTGGNSGSVGLNGVLGGTVFIICIVVGVVSLFIADKGIKIDKNCFIRDICFFLFTIVCLTLILIIGKVSIWGAMAFVSIYVVYALFVAGTEMMKKKGSSLGSGGVTPLLPVAGSFYSSGTGEGEEDGSVCAPLLSPDNAGSTPEAPAKLPHWIWNTNFAIYSDYAKPSVEDGSKGVWGWNDDGVMDEVGSSWSFSKICSYLEIPLIIPRRLTIPVVEEERWSKAYAIASAFLAPVLVAFLWNTQEGLSPLSGKIAYIIAFFGGFVFSLLAFLYTSPDHPPRRFLFPWVCAGFFMSIIWFYIVADELVALLVSLGAIFGVNPSLLALTVLAWGNSVGDLMSNTALAMNDRNGAQIAMSGCYAGPMFNTLIGLGMSLVFATWSESKSYVIAPDSGLFITVGFLTVGLIWALIVLPQSDMRPNRILGVGLIIIYAIFLSLRISIAMIWGSKPA